MVLGLFGKKKAPEQKVNQPSAQDMELERQRKLVNMQKTLEEMREKIEVYYAKCDQKQAKVKELIRQKKKNEAKRQLQVLKAIQEELAKQENMCIILEKTKIQLEVAADTSKMVDVFKDAVSLQKEAEKNREFLEDFLIDKREMDEQNKEIGNLLNDIAAGTEEEKEEIDDLYKELEQEVLDEQIDNINNDPLKNATKPQVQTHVQPANTNTHTQNKQMEESSIDDLLKEAALYS
jgi:hypothetical protein